MTVDKNTDGQTFWEHLDALRYVLIKITAVTVLAGIVAFVFKEKLFSFVLAPKDAGFITYDILFDISRIFDGSDNRDFSVQLINTGLAEQFIIHVKTAMCAGILCASPYIIYQLFRFVSPALYSNEKKYVISAVGSGYIMFMLGAAVGYFIIFPLTFRFLGTYQVADDVPNMISLQSYISTLIMMCLAMGIVFEMPVLTWLFARLGFISSSFMRRYRRHAIVIILTVAAIITPTSDVFTLLAVSLPMWLLYEASIFVAASAYTESAGHPQTAD